MDQQLIKALIDALANADLTELEYSAGGETLRLVKAGASRASTTPSALVAPSASVAPQTEAARIVTAPLYGVVHLHRSPDLPPLVTRGDAVAAGQVLCLIEAMKLLTELRAERAGVLEAVLVTTGQEVEAGQPLFRLA